MLMCHCTRLGGAKSKSRIIILTPNPAQLALKLIQVFDTDTQIGGFTAWFIDRKGYG